MAGDDRALLRHEDGIGPSPFPERCSDLVDLLAAVGPRIAGIWNELGDWPALDLVGRPKGNSHSVLISVITRLSRCLLIIAVLPSNDNAPDLGDLGTLLGEL